MPKRSVADDLNMLVAVCEDGVQAFRMATKEVDDRDLKRIFYDLAIERDHTTVALRKAVRDLGEDFKKSGTAGGLALRAYADLKAALAKHTDAAVLEELARSEDRILARFDAVLEETLPAALRKTVAACRREVARSRLRIKGLERMRVGAET